MVIVLTARAHRPAPLISVLRSNHLSIAGAMRLVIPG